MRRGSQCGAARVGIAPGWLGAWFPSFRALSEDARDRAARSRALHDEMRRLAEDDGQRGQEQRQQQSQDSATPLRVASLEKNEAFELGPARKVRAWHLFNSATLLRERGAMRRAVGSCVIGGSEAIRRVWHDYGVRPNVVFVPDGAPVPAWCRHPTQPSFVVQASAARIRHSLLSSERADGFAAEFPLPPLPSPLTLLVPPSELVAGSGRGTAPFVPRLRRVLVLHRVRIPDNVGLLLRAARQSRFDAVLLDDCADPFGEKVLRASGGAVFATRPLGVSGGSSGPPALGSCAVQYALTPDALAGQPSTRFLQCVAAAHRLLPVFAVPSAVAPPMGDVASRFHRVAWERAQASGGGGAGSSSSSSSGASAIPNPESGMPESGDSDVGVMLVLGAERQGLNSFVEQWSAPSQAASLAMDNTSYIDNINVAAAGAIAMRFFRPAATAEYAERFRRGIVAPDPTEGSEDSALSTIMARIAAGNMRPVAARDGGESSAAGNDASVGAAASEEGDGEADESELSEDDLDEEPVVPARRR